MLRNLIRKLIMEARAKGPSASEVRDASEVMNGYLYHDKGDRLYKGGMRALKLFREKAKSKDWEAMSIPLSKIEIFHDWGRRIKNKSRLKRPIIVVNMPRGKYKVLDGQHRVITLREMGETEVDAYVITLPLATKKRARTKRSSRTRIRKMSL